ncbi:hypothetical protein STEG23_021660 [Scotinomys teguina]
MHTLPRLSESPVQVQTPLSPAATRRGGTAALALGGFAGHSGATGGQGAGDPATGTEKPVGLRNRELCPEKPEAWRPWEGDALRALDS